MKKNIRKILIIFWSVVLAIIIARAPRVGAEEVEPAQEPTATTVTVQLTAAQTLALFGQSFQALYYDNGTVRNITFDFDKSSRTIVDQCNDILDSWSYNDQMSSFFPSGVQNGITSFMCNNDNSSLSSLFSNQLWSNSEWLGVENGSVIDREKLQGYEFLFYKCEGIDTEPVSSNTFDFQLNINFPFVISGVERFQSVFSSQIGVYTPSMAYSTPHGVRNSNLGSEIRLYGSSNQLYPIATTSDTHITGNSSYFGYFFHPLNTADPSKIVRAVPIASVLDRVLSYYGVFGMCIMDESISNNDITGINWNIRNCNSYFAVQKQGFWPEYTDISDPNDANYQWQDNAVYLMIMCPRIQGEFTIGRPSGSGSYIDYTESFDKLISGSEATNNKLDIIIQKLNQIYNQMVSDNGGVDLVEPETIGFTQQQKQQILDGVSSLDSAMDDLSPEDLPTETIGGFFDIWDSITSAIPPGLMALYIFALVGGIASWVIFSGRGG